MILPFQTKFKNGTPTCFILKIWESLALQTNFDSLQYQEYKEAYKFVFSQYWDGLGTCSVNPKHHSMREDKHDRWRPGMKIHPVVFNRTKNQFQFAPVLKCKSIQRIEIAAKADEVPPQVYVDGRWLTVDEIEQLAKNDGFDSVEHFFEWFNKDFAGKIIHWTDLRY